VTLVGLGAQYPHRKPGRSAGVLVHMHRHLLVLSTVGLALALACKSNTSDTTPPTSDEDGVMCTMDAKICPDGSAVGRSGPDCEFDPCPGPSGNESSDDEPSDDESSDDEPSDDDEG
jgi:hypothetical protein